MRIRKGYFDGPFGQLHYRECGLGRPLILLHQSPLSSLQFEAALPALAARGVRAIAVDMPGFGLSTPVGERPTLSDFATTVAACLNSFHITTAALLGHHTGAVVAAEFAANHPARVERLILNGVPMLTDEERSHFRSFDFGPVEPRADGSHLTRAWESRLRATPGWSDLAVMHRYVVDGPVAGATNWMAFPLIVAADVCGLLERIEVPTLLLTNTGEDLYAATRRAAERFPRFRYAELQGGTHDIVDEQPVAWVRCVCGFLG